MLAYPSFISLVNPQAKRELFSKELPKEGNLLSKSGAQAIFQSQLQVIHFILSQSKEKENLRGKIVESDRTQTF